MKLNEVRKMTLEGHNPWQQAKYIKLFSNLLLAQKKRTFHSSGHSANGGFSLCVRGTPSH